MHEKFQDLLQIICIKHNFFFMIITKIAILIKKIKSKGNWQPIKLLLQWNTNKGQTRDIICKGVKDMNTPFSVWYPLKNQVK